MVKFSATAICAFLSFLIPLAASHKHQPDGYAVGIFPSLGIIVHGLVTGLAKWLSLVLSKVMSGGSLEQVLGTLGSLFTSVQSEVDPGVEDLTDTLTEPITSIK